MYFGELSVIVSIAPLSYKQVFQSSPNVTLYSSWKNVSLIMAHALFKRLSATIDHVDFR
jgi:hypothetical protein